MNIFSSSNNILARKWYVIDAKDKILGRLSSTIVKFLIGKNKVEYVPYLDIGDYVIVINAKLIFVSGRKYKDKIYYHHTGYIGGIKSLSFEWMINHHPERVLEFAVKGMLPKGKLGRVMYRRLKVYSGNMHIHHAQAPQLLDC